MTDDLARRLKALRAGEASQPVASSSKLVIEPKARPQLVARGSELSGTDTTSSLVDDLAAALGEDGGVNQILQEKDTTQGRDLDSLKALDREASQVLREANSLAKTQGHDKEPLPPEEQNDPSEDAEVDALIARLTALRDSGPDASTSTSTTEASLQDTDTDTSQETPLNLPSVPTDLPSIPSHPTLGSAHSDIDSARDLTPFKRLISGDMDVRDLPLSRELAPPPADDSDPSQWCSICTEDATISCFSPTDEDEGCAGDLYCAECWVQGHGGMRREELRDHRTREVRRVGKGRGGMGGSGTGRKAMPA